MSSVARAGGRRSTSRARGGRHDVLDRLEGLLGDTVEAGRLTTAVVEGPAGIGKTRALTELAVRLRDRGGDVLTGHCVPQGGQTLPYAPLVELVSELVRAEGATAV